VISESSFSTSSTGETARTFKDLQNPNSAGLILEVPDMEQFRSSMESDEVKKAMQEDGLKARQ
jgi:hypothetical protein